MDILVDSNVILDIVTEDRRWFQWSSDTLAKYAETHILVINPIVYAEVSIGFHRIEDVEMVLPPAFFRRDPLPWKQLSLRANAFQLIVKEAAGGVQRFLTFSLVLMLRLLVFPY